MRRELVTWDEVGRLIDHLIVQFEYDFEAMVMITRGGIIPGGMLAEPRSRLASPVPKRTTAPVT